MVSYDEQKRLVDEAADKFEQEFGPEFRNPAFPGEVFRVNRGNSYFSDCYGVQLYVDIRTTKDTWSAFAKGTLQELRQNSRRLA